MPCPLAPMIPIAKWRCSSALPNRILISVIYSFHLYHHLVYIPTLPRLRPAATMQRHTFTALNSTFIVDSEYQFVKELGQGAYGCVVAARHRRSGEGCAIKKITNINTKVYLDFAIHDGS